MCPLSIVKRTLLVVTNLNAVVWTLFALRKSYDYVNNAELKRQLNERQLKEMFTVQLVFAIVLLLILVFMCSTLEVYAIYKEILLLIVIFAVTRVIGCVTFAVTQHYAMFVVYFTISILYVMFVHLLRKKLTRNVPAIVVYHVS